MSILLTLAALAAVQSGDPVTTVVGDAVPSMRISYADLNLTTRAGQKRLHYRVLGARRALCGIADGRDLIAHTDIGVCSNQVMASAAPQVAAAIAAAQARMAAGSNDGAAVGVIALTKPAE